MPIFSYDLRVLVKRTINIISNIINIAVKDPVISDIF